jgi:hypothetical protein
MGVARAQVPGAAPDPNVPPAEPAPAAAVEPAPVAASAAVQNGGVQIDRPATLETGRILLRVPLLISLTKENVAKPLSIAPDIYYGVNDDLTVGITHNGSPFTTGGNLVSPPLAGMGLCLSGEDDGNCRKVYNNIGLDALYRFLNNDGLQLAAHGGLDFQQLSDDLLMGLHLGVYGEWQAGIFELRFDPSLEIALNKRDNRGPFKQIINIPVGGFVNVTPELEVFILAGLSGPTDKFGDTFLGLLSFGADYAVTQVIDVGLAFDFPNLWGKDGIFKSGADYRQLRLFGNFRF